MSQPSAPLATEYLPILQDRLDHIEDGAQALILLIEGLAAGVPDDHAMQLAAARFAARAMAEQVGEALVTARRIAGG